MLGKLYKLLPLGKHPPPPPPTKKKKNSQANGMEGFKSAGMFLENQTDMYSTFFWNLCKINVCESLN